MKSLWFLAFLLFLMVVFNGLAFGETGVYEMRPPSFTAQQATQVTQSVRTGAAGTLSQIGQSHVRPIGPLASPTAPLQKVLVFGPAAGKARATFNETRSRLVIHPELTALQGAPPSADAASAVAKQFATQQLGLGAEIQNWNIARVTTVAKMGSQPGSTRQDVARTVHFSRTLDGLPVVGPNSTLSVTVGPQSQVVGAVRSFLPLAKSAGPAQNMKNRQVLDQELNTKISQLAGRFPGAQLSLQNSRLVYYEQGGKYLQPALMGQVIVKNAAGFTSGLLVTVPALPTPPEPIVDSPSALELPTEPPKPTAPSSLPTSPQSQKPATTTPQALPKPLPPILPGVSPEDLITTNWMREQSQPEVRFVVYQVRNDYPEWSTDAIKFISSLTTVNAAIRTVNPNIKPVIKSQYVWNYISCWRDVNGSGDLSASFMRMVDVALILGHGKHYEITTLGNSGDIIRLDGIPGYGVNSKLGGRTDYIIWKSCSVLPAPVDDGNCWSHYFPLFKGIRGLYGFRTVSYVGDGILEDFAYDIALGVPMLTAWFNAAEASPCHWYGSDSASAIFPEGLDNQTIYDNNSVANAERLQMWWQY